MLSRDKITEIFCIADDFYKKFDSNMKEMTLKADGKKHRNRKASLSDAEIMTILICFHFPRIGKRPSRSGWSGMGRESLK